LHPVLITKVAGTGIREVVDKTARPSRLKLVDGLRLLAALMVVSFHHMGMRGDWSRPTPDVFPIAHIPAAYGWLGVQLFFS
jgi:peptidoglycan/LPS O-acetylase OafA/YrhL